MSGVTHCMSSFARATWETEVTRLRENICNWMGVKDFPENSFSCFEAFMEKAMVSAQCAYSLCDPGYRKDVVSATRKYQTHSKYQASTPLAQTIDKLRKIALSLDGDGKGFPKILCGALVYSDRALQQKNFWTQLIQIQGKHSQLQMLVVPDIGISLQMKEVTSSEEDHPLLFEGKDSYVLRQFVTKALLERPSVPKELWQNVLEAAPTVTRFDKTALKTFKQWMLSAFSSSRTPFVPLKHIVSVIRELNISPINANTSAYLSTQLSAYKSQLDKDTMVTLFQLAVDHQLSDLKSTCHAHLARLSQNANFFETPLYKNMNRLMVEEFTASIADQETLSKVSVFPNLLRLKLSFKSEIVFDLNPLQKLTKLTALELVNIEPDFSFLSSLPQLETLTLASLCLEKDLPPFPTLAHLKTLKVHVIDRSENVSLFTIAMLSSLSVLQLCGNIVDNDMTLLRNLNCTTVIFAWCPHITLVARMMAEMNESVEEITVHSCAQHPDQGSYIVDSEQET